MALRSKVIITCAVTGSIHTPTMSPYLPLTPDEIAQQSIEAAEAGAAIIHLHARDRRLVKPPLFVQTIFGILGGIGADPENLAHMKRIADKLFGDQYAWSVLAAGRHQLPFVTMAAVMGGNVRVGLEDSIYVGKGQ